MVRDSSFVCELFECGRPGSRVDSRPKGCHGSARWCVSSARWYEVPTRVVNGAHAGAYCRPIVQAMGSFEFFRYSFFFCYLLISGAGLLSRPYRGLILLRMEDRLLTIHFSHLRLKKGSTTTRQSVLIPVFRLTMSSTSDKYVGLLHPNFHFSTNSIVLPGSTPQRSSSTTYHAFRRFNGREGPFRNVKLLTKDRSAIATRLGRLLRYNGKVTTGVGNTVANSERQFNHLSRPTRRESVSVPIFHRTAGSCTVRLRLLTRFSVRRRQLGLYQHVRRITSAQASGRVCVGEQDRYLHHPSLPMTKYHSPFQSTNAGFRAFYASNFYFRATLYKIYAGFSGADQFRGGLAVVISAACGSGAVVQGCPVFPKGESGYVNVRLGGKYLSTWVLSPAGQAGRGV